MRILSLYGYTYTVTFSVNFSRPNMVGNKPSLTRSSKPLPDEYAYSPGPLKVRVNELGFKRS